MDSIDFSESISLFLDEYPFASAKYISEHFKIKYSTMKDNLKILGFKKYNLKLVPYILTDEIKKKRIKYSKIILDILKQNEKTYFKNIITLDESWFYFKYFPKSQYVKNKSEISSIPKLKKTEKKVMITIVFCGSGFLLIDALPKGYNFNSSYFIEYILSNLEQKILEKRPKNGLKNILIHFDNAKPHIAIKVQEKIDELKMKRIIQPPYSPDISPCDFWLFGFIKEKLKGNSFESSDEVLLKINEIIKKIDKKTIYSVFYEWISRLENVIENKGDYI